MNYVDAWPPVANRDPLQFTLPDAFDPQRSPNRHIALGMGIHKCLGIHLTRVSMQVGIQELMRRIPEWDLDPMRRPEYATGIITGFVSLPIVFSAGSRAGDTTAHAGAIV